MTPSSLGSLSQYCLLPRSSILRLSTSCVDAGGSHISDTMIGGCHRYCGSSTGIGCNPHRQLHQMSVEPELLCDNLASQEKCCTQTCLESIPVGSVQETFAKSYAVQIEVDFTSGPLGENEWKECQVTCDCHSRRAPNTKTNMQAKTAAQLGCHPLPTCSKMLGAT